MDRAARALCGAGSAPVSPGHTARAKSSPGPGRELQGSSRMLAMSRPEFAPTWTHYQILQGATDQSSPQIHPCHHGDKYRGRHHFTWLPAPVSCMHTSGGRPAHSATPEAPTRAVPRTPPQPVTTLHLGRTHRPFIPPTVFTLSSGKARGAAEVTACRRKPPNPRCLIQEGIHFTRRRKHYQDSRQR